ncbi:MAG: hypothetical protein JJ891_16725 [Rhizobiaceae bacterium]|nr:hypothetical protein [Rhizobiaceae bacterium]
MNTATRININTEEIVCPRCSEPIPFEMSDAIPWVYSWLTRDREGYVTDLSFVTKSPPFSCPSCNVLLIGRKDVDGLPAWLFTCRTEQDLRYQSGDY